MSFSSDISKFMDGVVAKSDLILKSSFIELGNRMVRRSPVGNKRNWKIKKAPRGYVGGHFKANWQTGVDMMPAGEVAGTSASKSTSGLKKVKSARKGAWSRLYLVNNVPYAQAIEDGHSTTQSPKGVVKISIVEWPSIVRMMTKAL